MPHGRGIVTLFDGVTYAPEHDEARLTGQLAQVHELLSSEDDYDWWTIQELADKMPGATEASISARIRDLRKPRFGGYLVERRRRGGPPSGCWEYRLGDKGAHVQRLHRNGATPERLEALSAAVWCSFYESYLSAEQRDDLVTFLEGLAR